MKKKLNLNRSKYYPVSLPFVSNSDIKSINKVLKSGWISSEGPEVIKFEKTFSKLVNRKFSIAVSSGTAALEIAIKSLNLKKNDEVIIPNFTIISNYLAVTKQNLSPKFVDCNLDTWNMDLDLLKKKISNKTKAIIVTHIYSFPNDMDKIIKLCKKKNIFIIEDSAEVLGIKYKNNMCGSFGHISTFSFYANKQITTGEGGMISTNNVKIFNKCKSLRNLCFGKIDRFNHADIGWNYRITNIQAALGLSQIKNLSKMVNKKISIGKRYYNNLRFNKNIFIQPPENSFSKNIYWVVGVVIKNKKIKAKKLMQKLNYYGIGTRPFFWPMNKQSIVIQREKKDRETYPNSEYLSQYGLYLPSYFTLKNKDIDYISNVVNKLLK